MSTATDLKSRIDADMKAAMRAREKVRLGALRLLLAAIKQKEVDERITLDDAQVLAIVEKLSKQRRDSIEQFEKAGRPDGETLVVKDAEAESVHAAEAPYNAYDENVTALQVFDGVLYALSSQSNELRKYDSHYWMDAFKNSGILYKIGSTKDTLSGRAVVLAKKGRDDANKIGYGFYRFIAVKYDEAERIKLIIASDGAWGEGGLPLDSSPDVLKNTDRVLEYDLKGSLQAERETGGSFSKTLEHGSGFGW